MKKSYWRFLSLILGVFVIWGCMNLNKYCIAEKTFDPYYTSLLNQKHLAIIFKTIKGKGKNTILKPHKAELRPGQEPYNAGGDTVVVYKDVNGENKVSFSVENPVKIRICEKQKGGKALVGKLIPITAGREVELLLPANPDIAFLDIYYELNRIRRGKAPDVTPQTDLDVRKVVEEAFKQ
ncbi:MAG: hypothetical protein ACYSTS_09690 [Planctomycetota bacterium]|jgi:hypothetical protein